MSPTRSPRPIRTALPPLRWVDVMVTAVRPITPRMIRVTVTGSGLRAFADAGPDQWLKLVLPRDGRVLPPFDPDANALDWWRGQSDDVRPYLRNYTVRAVRAETDEIDVDVALHDIDTVMMRWIRAVRIGDQFALYGVRSRFDPPPGTDWILLIADETAVPAVAAILEAHPHLPARVIAEVEDAGDIVPLRLPAHQRIVWITRDGHRAPGDPAGLLLELDRLEPLDGARYAWAAGETGAIAALRPRLGTEGTDLIGYWRRGEQDPD